MKDLYLNHEECIRIIELSDIDVRNRFNQYGYYGYNFKTKRLIQPMTRPEITNLVATIKQYKEIMVINNLATVVVDLDRELVAFKLYTLMMDSKPLYEVLNKLLVKFNLIVVAQDTKCMLSKVYRTILK